MTYIPALALLLFCASVTLAVPGKLIVNGKTVVLSHVYARTAPQTFDPKKLTTYILAVDRELEPAVRVDEDAVRGLTFTAGMHVVEIELTDGGISWMIASRQATLSGSQSPNPFPVTVGGGRLRGMVKMEAPKKLGETEYYFEFPVDAVLEVKKTVPPPTAADAAAARRSAAAQAYLAYQVVLAKGDKAGLKKAVDPAKAAMIDTPDFPEMLKFIQSMQPKNIQVLRVTETGDEAELTVSGNGGSETGTVKMKKAGENWLVVNESWRNR